MFFLINIPPLLLNLGTLVIGGTLVTAIYQWWILPSRIRRAKMEEQTEEFDLVRRTKEELEKANADALGYMKVANENRDKIFLLQEELRQLSAKINMREQDLLATKEMLSKIEAEKNDWKKKYKNCHHELDSQIAQNKDLRENLEKYQEKIRELNQRMR